MAQIDCAGWQCLRRIALLLSVCLTWSFAVAPMALAATASPAPSARVAALPAALQLTHDLRVAEQRQQRQALAQMEMQAAVTAPGDATPLAAPMPPHARVGAPLTLLDPVGNLAHPLDPRAEQTWKAQLHIGQQIGRTSALLHLRLGEAELARDKQPEAADTQFAEVEQLSKPSSPVYGRAAYDSVLTLFYRGAYAEAADGFLRLLRHPRLCGFSRTDCALWMRHADSCAGYHAEHARLGIPEPPQLDPLCGAAALAASLRALGRPYDRAAVVRAVRPTGEGSTLGDLVAAGPRLGVTVRALTADAAGLMALPKPVAAYVEGDHFVSVIRADKSGVAYLCSDCGPWPGGEVDLTWRQWRVVSSGIYAAVVPTGGDWDKTLAALGANTSAAPVRISMAGGLSSLHLSARAVLSARLPLLRGHVVLTDHPGPVSCGSKPPALPCPPYYVCCWDCYLNSLQNGPTSGDPVDLASGEEDYHPAADLTVYNPVGPSVTWQREYRSLRAPMMSDDGLNDITYEEDDFGVGWSQNYNMGVYNPDALLATNPWPDIDTAATTNVPPVTSVSEPSVSQNTWSVTNPSGTTIASNTSPNGWNVTLSGSNLAVTVPSGTTPGLVYSATFQAAGTTTMYPADFNVLAGVPSTGTKAIFFPNGSRATFTASQVPNASTPTVTCTVQSGAPYLVKWIYDSGNAWGHFVITDAARTQWVTNDAGPGSQWMLAQEIDRNGNAITFHDSAPLTTTVYGRFGPVTVPVDGFPLLSSITNSAGTTLLTITRASNGNITKMADCYGRAVAYQEAAYTPAYYQELTQVSEVSPSSLSSPPARWTYGYQEISNTVGSIQVAFLHTITVPSPTGSGTSQATINYNSTTDLVSSVQDGNGNTRTYTSTTATGTASYPSNYTTVTVTNSSGGTVYTYTAGWDSNMDETSRTDGAGNVTSSSVYGSPNDPYAPSQVTDGNGNVWNYTYDSYGNELTETPPSNSYRTPATTTNTYSYTNFGLGELTQTQEGSKTATSYAYYEPSGLVQTVTGPQPGSPGTAGIVLGSYVYDSLGNVTSMTAPGPNSTPAATTGASGYSTYVTTTYNYTTDGSYSQGDSIGEPLTVTDPLGHTTHFRYQESVPWNSSSINRGETVSTIDALGNETDSEFNIDGRPVETLFPATGQSGSGRGDVVTGYLYDESGDTSGQEEYGPTVTAKTYDEGSNLLRTVSTAYGMEGETLSVSGSTEPVTYTYDALYRMSSLADGGSNKTRYFYNSQGYLYQVAYPLSGVTTTPASAGTADTMTYTGYDLDGNVLGRTDGNGTTTAYTYHDPESLLTDVHYVPGSGVSALADTTYAYDQYGRRASMTDGSGSQSYTYDDDDATLSDATTYTGLSAKTVSYTYFPDGSRSTMTTPAGGFSYAYDNAGRETSLTNPFGEETAWGYDNNDWLADQNDVWTLVTFYTYDAKGEVTNAYTRNGAPTMLANFTVPSSGGYDGAGDRLGVTVTGASLATGQTADTYDGRSELMQEASTRGSGYTDVQQYDGVTSGTTTGPGNPTEMRGINQTFSADNQLVQSGGTGGFGNGASNFGDNGNGNPTLYKGTVLVFDPENRMTGYGSVQTDGYNGDGLRAWKQTSSGRTYFLYDGEQAVCELNSSGSVTATNTFGANGLVSRHTGGSSAFYVFDLSGNVAERANSSGTVLSSDLTDGFGNQQTTDTTHDPFGFSGQYGGYTDAETGLTLLTHRYYDAVTGRWLTRDPMGYGGGVNLYGYCGNDPVDESDPSGKIARLSPIGGPQSYEECVQLAASALKRRLDEAKGMSGVKKAKFLAQAYEDYADQIAECTAQEAEQETKKCLENINDILNNTVPGTDGQPIIGPIVPPKMHPIPGWPFGPGRIPVYGE